MYLYESRDWICILRSNYRWYDLHRTESDSKNVILSSSTQRFGSALLRIKYFKHFWLGNSFIENSCTWRVSLKTANRVFFCCCCFRFSLVLMQNKSRNNEKKCRKTRKKNTTTVKKWSWVVKGCLLPLINVLAKWKQAVTCKRKPNWDISLRGKEAYILFFLN